MRLADFIRQNADQIVAEWVDFASGYLAAGRALNIDDLRDHAEEILAAIALDLAATESEEQRDRKAKGKSDVRQEQESAAKSHGAERVISGFRAQDVVAEFRALRASVLRLWAKAEGDAETQSEGQRASTTLEDVHRFNEAIDQALTESIGRYIHDLDESKHLFLGILGHDLRNPLGAIMMSATAMLEAKGDASTAERRGPELILRSGLRMEHIINDLLDFTRSHLGSGIPITRVDMDLARVCRQTVDEIAALHPRRDLRFEVTGHVRGRWDSDRVAQVLSNLLGNAIQHSSTDSPIAVALSGHRDHVSIAVHNWGPPIPPNRLGDIFSPMKRAAPESSPDRRLGNLGLGLYIAKEVAKSHGGTIHVESNSEHGTCFTVRLPRVKEMHEAHALHH